MSPMTQFALNGVAVTVDSEPDRPLIDVLRETFDLFSVRSSCGIGTCGTCTVLLDGRPVSACLQLLGMVEGRELRTTEGEGLDEVQRRSSTRRPSSVRSASRHGPHRHVHPT